MCHIIDELLNLELYRREFQFLQPVFPPDDEEDLDGEEDQNQDEDSDGENVIMINGGAI